MEPLGIEKRKDVSDIVSRRDSIFAISNLSKFGKTFLTCAVRLALIHFLVLALIYFTYASLTFKSRFMPPTPSPSIHYAALSAKADAAVAKAYGMLFDSNTFYQMLTTWLTLVITAVGAMSYYKLRNFPTLNLKHKIIHHTKVTCKRVGDTQLYPAKFWIWWCGGVNLIDAILVLIWLAFHAYWMAWGVKRSLASVNEKVASGEITDMQGLMILWKGSAAALGSASMLDMAIVFMPIARNSFLHYIFNTDFTVLTKYHRWIGYSLVWTTTIHGMMYYVLWTFNEENSFWTEALKWNNAPANNLAGTLSTAFALALVVTSIDYVRRSQFQIFIYFHYVCFIGFTVFAYVHFWQRWLYQTPGITLMVLDWVFRLNQWLNPNYVKGKFISTDKAIVTLEIECRKACIFGQNRSIKPGDFLFLNLPTKMRLHWHPITIAQVGESSEGHHTLLVHVKSYGCWTKALVDVIKTEQSAVMRIDGPYGRPYGIHWQEYGTIVMIVGGIGITPMLALLQQIKDTHDRFDKSMFAIDDTEENDALIDGDLLGPDETSLTKVILHWACRGSAEFDLLPLKLIDESKKKNGWFKLHLYDTKTTAAVSNGSGNNIFLPERRYVINPSGYHWEATHKPFEPYPEGWTWIIAHLLAFAGSFFALLMVKMYDSYTGLTGSYKFQDWKVGMLCVIATFMGPMGLTALFVFTTSIWQRKMKRINLYSKLNTNDGQSLATKVSVSSSNNYGHISHTLDEVESLLIKEGRPEIGNILSDVANAAGADRLAAFAAGPDVLVKSVQLACVEHNRNWKNKFIEFESHAFEL